MTDINIFLIVVVLFLSYLVWHRFRAERALALALFSLKDSEKHFIKHVLENGRVEVNNSTDLEILTKLDSELWLFQLGPGVYVAGEKAEYLNDRLKT